MNGRAPIDSSTRRGLAQGIAAYGLWGVLPVYFKAIDAVAAKLMGFDPLSMKYIRLAHDAGLGCGDPREIEMVGEALPSLPLARHVHFGGGSPTFLSPAQIRRLGAMIHARHRLAPDADASVEVDPRHLTPEQARAYFDLGCRFAQGYLWSAPVAPDAPPAPTGGEGTNKGS